MILLDAPLLVTWLGGHPDLKASRVSLLHADGQPKAISDLGLVEIAEHHRQGALNFTLPLQIWLESALSQGQILTIPLTPAIAARAARLQAGRDFYDRVLLATALEHDLEVATLDDSLTGIPGVRYLF